MQKISTEASRAVVAGFFRDLRAGDMDALRATFAPDATWTLRGSLPASGKWTGPEGIMDGFFARIFGRLDPAAPVVQDVHRTMLASRTTISCAVAMTSRATPGRRRPGGLWPGASRDAVAGAAPVVADNAISFARCVRAGCSDVISVSS